MCFITQPLGLIKFRSLDMKGKYYEAVLIPLEVFGSTNAYIITTP